MLGIGTMTRGRIKAAALRAVATAGCGARQTRRHLATQLEQTLAKRLGCIQHCGRIAGHALAIATAAAAFRMQQLILRIGQPAWTQCNGIRIDAGE